MKKRTDFEYVLKRRQLVIDDFRIYLSYEIMLDDLRLARTHRIGKDSSKETTSLLRSIQAGFIRHISYIFERAIRRFPSHLPFWLEYIAFLNKRKSTSILNTVYGRVLALFPKSEEFWLQAAIHELEMNNNTHAARVILQRGIRTNGRSTLLWTKYFEVELWSALKIAERERLLGIDNDSASSTAPLAATALVVFKHAATALSSVEDVLKLYQAAEGTLLSLTTNIETELISRFPANMKMWCCLIEQNTNRCLTGYTSKKVLNTAASIFTACSLALEAFAKLASDAEICVYSHVTDNDSRVQQFSFPIIKAAHAVLMQISRVCGSMDSCHFEGQVATKRPRTLCIDDGLHEDRAALTSVVVWDPESAEGGTTVQAMRLFHASLEKIHKLIAKFATGESVDASASTFPSSTGSIKVSDCSINVRATTVGSVSHCMVGALQVVRQRIALIEAAVGLPHVVATREKPHQSDAAVLLATDLSSGASSGKRKRKVAAASTENASGRTTSGSEPIGGTTASSQASPSPTSRDSYIRLADVSQWIRETAEIIRVMPMGYSFDEVCAQQLDVFAFVIDNTLQVAMRLLAREVCNTDASGTPGDSNGSIPFSYGPAEAVSCVDGITAALSSVSATLIASDLAVRNNLNESSYCRLYESSQQYSYLVNRAVECSMMAGRYSMVKNIYLHVIDYHGFNLIDKGICFPDRTTSF